MENIYKIESTLCTTRTFVPRKFTQLFCTTTNRNANIDPAKKAEMEQNITKEMAQIRALQAVQNKQEAKMLASASGSGAGGNRFANAPA